MNLIICDHCGTHLEEVDGGWQSVRVRELRKAIAPVLTLAIRGKYIALPVSTRDALRDAYYTDT